MIPAWVLPYLFVFWLFLDINQVVLFCLRIKNLKTHHKEELSLAKYNAFNQGWNEARLSLPIVQHCNSRTDYATITHQWDPGACKECRSIGDLLEL